MAYNRSFTLVEVLIVVLIIGILSCLAIPTFQGAIIKARCGGIFVLVREVELEILLWGEEYGWDYNKFNLDLTRSNPSGTIRIDYYSFGVTSGVVTIVELHIQADSKPIPPPLEGNYLCSRVIRKNGVNSWYVCSDHPWAPYFKKLLPPESVIDQLPI